MADKYLIHGATYNGDGTTSAEAASNGAPGAWNNIGILTGTAVGFGSLDAGDVVYIRSKTSGGADITVTMTSANLTWNNGTPTLTAPITWILDNGEVWSGIDGTLKFTCAVVTYVVTVAANNHIISKTQDRLVFENTANNASTANVISVGRDAVIENALFDTSGKGGGRPTRLLVSGVLINPHIKLGVSNHTDSWIYTGIDSFALLINPNIETLSTTATCPLFSVGADNGGLRFIGGKLTGLGAEAGFPLFVAVNNANSARYQLIGFQYPNAITIPDPSTGYTINAELYGIDGKQGSLLYDSWGWASSRNDDNPPVLNAVLPDSAATKWAWRVYPVNASMARQVTLPVAKTYTAAAAAKTVTLEFLKSTSYSGLDTSNLWIDVSYIDNTTGLPASVSSRESAGAALDTSTAAWTSVTWGLVNFTKHKFSVTTPTSIKQDTPVIVTLRGTKGAVGISDILFVCPDVQLS
jgi:hypothetical protein